MVGVELKDDVVDRFDKAAEATILLLGFHAFGYGDGIRGAGRIPGRHVTGAGDDATVGRREPHGEPAVHRREERLELDLALLDHGAERLGLEP